jgi:hypothetical protein
MDRGLGRHIDALIVSSMPFAFGRPLTLTPSGIHFSRISPEIRNLGSHSVAAFTEYSVDNFFRRLQLEAKERGKTRSDLRWDTDSLDL